jgi:hypothetical protein
VAGETDWSICCWIYVGISTACNVDAESADWRAYEASGAWFSILACTALWVADLASIYWWVSIRPSRTTGTTKIFRREKVIARKAFSADERGGTLFTILNSILTGNTGVIG